MRIPGHIKNGCPQSFLGFEPKSKMGFSSIVLQLPVSLFGHNLSRPQLLRAVLQLVTGVRGMRFKFEEEDADRITLFLPMDDTTQERVHRWVQKQFAVALNAKSIH